MRASAKSVPFLMTVILALSQAKHMAGNDLVLAHLRRHPDLLHQALNVITETTIRSIEAAKATGISGIYYAIQHANYALLNREEYLAFGRPYDLRILEAAADLWCTIIHLHGDQVMFDLVAAYPVPFLNWHDRDSAVSLPDGLAQFRGAASGGVSQWSIHQESPAATLAEMADAIEQTGGSAADAGHRLCDHGYHAHAQPARLSGASRPPAKLSAGQFVDDGVIRLNQERRSQGRLSQFAADLTQRPGGMAAHQRFAVT